MSQQRENSIKGNFGSSNARVAGRGLDIAGKVFFIDTVEELTDNNS